MKIRVCDLCGKRLDEFNREYKLIKTTFFSFDKINDRVDICAKCMDRIIKECKRRNKNEFV